MKKLFLTLLPTLLGTIFVFGQKEYSSFTSTGRAGVSTTFSTDYQAIGINPANLGWKPKFDNKITFSILEFAASVHTDALARPDLYKALTNFNSTDFTQEQKKEAAHDFVDNPLAMNVDAMEFGFAIQLPKIGGIGFTIKDRFQWYSVFNQITSDILFEGYNAPYFTQKYDQFGNLLSDATVQANPDTVKLGKALTPELFSKILDGTTIDMAWYRTYNISYGRKLINHDDFKLFGGVGIKYVQGNAIAEVNVNGGKLTAFSAISPDFNIDYGDSVEKANPSTIDKKNTLLPPTGVGHGFGFDFGLSAKYKDKLTVGIALTDVGSVTYTGNLYEANDNYLDTLKSGGFNSYNIVSETQKIVGDGGIFKWKGLTSKKIALPTVFRAGASYKLLDGKIEMGVDAAFPINQDNGNFAKPVVSYGADFNPTKHITLSTGFSVAGNNGFVIPVGVTVRVGPKETWEFGIASRDIVTYLTNKRPTLSLAFGFLRFRIGSLADVVKKASM